jgi:hypothetical protein
MKNVECVWWWVVVGGAVRKSHLGRCFRLLFASGSGRLPFMRLLLRFLIHRVILPPVVSLRLRVLLSGRLGDLGGLSIVLLALLGHRCVGTCLSLIGTCTAEPRPQAIADPAEKGAKEKGARREREANPPGLTLAPLLLLRFLLLRVLPLAPVTGVLSVQGHVLRQVEVFLLGLRLNVVLVLVLHSVHLPFLGGLCLVVVSV